MKKLKLKKEMPSRNQEKSDLIDCIDEANTCCNRIATMGMLLWSQEDDSVNKVVYNEHELNISSTAGLMIAEEAAQLKEIIQKIRKRPSN